MFRNSNDLVKLSVEIIIKNLKNLAEISCLIYCFLLIIGYVFIYLIICLFYILKMYVTVLCDHLLKAIQNQKGEKKRKIFICWIWVLNMYRNLFGKPHKVSVTKTDWNTLIKHGSHSLLRGKKEENTGHLWASLLTKPYIITKKNQFKYQKHEANKVIVYLF